VLSADAEFRAAANAAFAAWQQQPPYIAYRADVDVSIPAQNRSQHIARAVEVRTHDDTAVLHDLPDGQQQLGHAFPIPPWFDALSYFRLQYRFGDPFRQHNPLTELTMQAPLHYTDPAASANPAATVIATTLRNYYATYAPDSNDRIAHIAMTPLPALTRGNDSDFYLHDVYVDTVTNLPTRVVYAGPTTTFSIDYTTVGTYWLVDHATYRVTFSLPLHIMQTTVTVDATMSGFTFPDMPTDPRLR